jgi:hypothetical protein
MLASFLLWRTADAYYMQLPRSLCEPVRKRIAMFILRSKVKAIDVSDGWALLGIAGTGTERILKQKLGHLPSAPMEIATAGNVFVLKLDSTRLQLMVAANYATQISGTLANETIPAGREAWDLLDIRAGVPFILPETQEQFVPQTANLDLIGGISFSKGCYPGQEIVARMHYLGKLKQRMYLAHIETAEPPRPGDRIVSAKLGGQASGMIINAAAVPEGGYDSLAVMQIESVAAGDARWKSLAGPLLRFRQLPYQAPSAARVL